MAAKQRQRSAFVACQQDVAGSFMCLAALAVSITQLVSLPAVEARAQPSLVRGDGVGRSPHRKLQQLFGSNAGLLQGFPTPTASICPATQTKISCFDPASDVPSYVCCPSAAYTCNVSSRTCAPVTAAPVPTTPAPTIPYPGPPVKGTGQLDPNCTLGEVTMQSLAIYGGTLYNGSRSYATIYYATVTHHCPRAVLTDLQVNLVGLTDFNAGGGVPVVEGLSECNAISMDGDPKPSTSCFLSPSVVSKYFVPPGFQPNQVIGQLPLSAGETYYFVYLDTVETNELGRFPFKAAGAIFEYQA